MPFSSARIFVVSFLVSFVGWVPFAAASSETGAMEQLLGRHQLLGNSLLGWVADYESRIAEGNFRSGALPRSLAVSWRAYYDVSCSLVAMEKNPEIRGLVDSRTSELCSAFSGSGEVKRLFAGFLEQESSEFRRFVSEASERKRLFKGFRFPVNVGLDALSVAYGKVVGSVAWRKEGRLTAENAFAEELEAELQPLDILFERKGYKLSNYSIPGYWGHVAIWLGTRSQLEALGVWEAAELNPFREQIERGNSIFEVRKSGTRFQSFDQWLSLDAVAVARREGLATSNPRGAEVLEVFGGLARQVGKPYDFAFDIAKTKRITCTELLFLAYEDIEWPTRSFLGRRFITPDDVAQAVYARESGFELVAYIDGRRRAELSFRSRSEFAMRLGLDELEQELIASLP